MNFITRNNDIKKRACDAINGLDGLWEVVIRPYNKRRSNPQNDCFHGWVHIIAQTLGMEASALKMALKVKCGLMEKHMAGCGAVYVLRSSADLTKEEFADLLNHTQVLADKYGIKLPQGGYDVPSA